MGKQSGARTAVNHGMPSTVTGNKTVSYSTRILGCRLKCSTSAHIKVHYVFIAFFVSFVMVNNNIIYGRTVTFVIF